MKAHDMAPVACEAMVASALEGIVSKTSLLLKVDVQRHMEKRKEQGRHSSSARPLWCC